VRRSRLLGCALAAALIAMAGCSAPEGRSLPPPSSTSSTVPEPTTSSIDYSQVALERVPGETTTTFATTGTTTLGGVVGGPGGNVAGALVRVEHLVGDAVRVTEVRSGDDGRWIVERLSGGRYRVRAYLAPNLTMTEPEIFFVPDGDERDVRLDLRVWEGLDVRAGTTPGAPITGDVLSLGVRVAERVVDEAGIARTRPLEGLVVRVRATGWTELRDEPDEPDDDDDDDLRGPLFGRDDDDEDVEDETPSSSSADVARTTDVDGLVVFTYRCDRAGEVTATAEVGPDRQLVPLEVPPCAPRPTTTTTSTTAAGDETTTSGDG